MNNRPARICSLSVTEYRTQNSRSQSPSFLPKSAKLMTVLPPKSPWSYVARIRALGMSVSWPTDDCSVKTPWTKPWSFNLPPNTGNEGMRPFSSSANVTAADMATNKATTISVSFFMIQPFHLHLVNSQGLYHVWYRLP